MEGLKKRKKERPASFAACWFGNNKDPAKLQLGKRKESCCVTAL
jgi:hypothetical protein